MLACCQRHQVQVVSDEIHHDILMPGHRHCSAARLWQGEGKPITFFSASKTFNLAGMKNSILVLPEEAQREQFDAFQRKLGISEGSTLDYIAVTAAFLGGKEWLEMVLHAIFQNACMLRETLSQFPEVVVSPLEGLIWQVSFLGRSSTTSFRTSVIWLRTTGTGSSRKERNQIPISD